jgi:hypothetical protein
MATHGNRTHASEISLPSKKFTQLIEPYGPVIDDVVMSGFLRTFEVLF